MNKGFICTILIILRRNTCMAYANSADPDQTPPDAASDLGLTLFAYILS